MTDYDLGDTVPLSVDVRNATGQLVNAGTIALTVTLPDGSTTEPIPANPTTGRYEHDYVPSVQDGRYKVRWQATNPAAAFTDTFDVRAADSIALFSLSSAKEHLKLDPADTTYDEDVRDHVDALTDVVEDIVGAVVRRTVTETHSGHCATVLIPRVRPVLSVTSVTVDGTLLDPAEYSLSDTGLLTRAAGDWGYGVNNVDLVYVAGRTAVPGSIRNAAKELLRINWRPRQGGNYSPFDGGRGDTQEPQGEWRLGFYLPNRVMQQLTPKARPPLVA